MGMSLSPCRMCSEDRLRARRRTFEGRFCRSRRGRLIVVGTQRGRLEETSVSQV